MANHPSQSRFVFLRRALTARSKTKYIVATAFLGILLSVILSIVNFDYENGVISTWFHLENTECKPKEMCGSAPDKINSSFAFSTHERQLLAAECMEDSIGSSSPANGLFASLISAYQHKVKKLFGPVGELNAPPGSFFLSITLTVLEGEQVFTSQEHHIIRSKRRSRRGMLPIFRRIVTKSRIQRLFGGMFKVTDTQRTLVKEKSCNNGIKFRMLSMDGEFSVEDALTALKLACCSLSDGGVFVLIDPLHPEVKLAIETFMDSKTCPKIVPFFHLENRAWFTTAGSEHDYAKLAVRSFDTVATQDALLGAQLQTASIPSFEYEASWTGMQQRDGRIQARWTDFLNGRDWREMSPGAQESKFPSALQAPEWVAPHFLEDPNAGETREALSMACDMYKGGWVYDFSYPLWTAGADSPVEARCLFPARDSHFSRLRWQPKDCRIPRFNALHFLTQMTGKRMAYVGDSIARGNFQSMAGMLMESAHPSRVQQVTVLRKNGAVLRPSLAYVFADYDFSLEFYVSQTLSHVKAVKPGVYGKEVRFTLMLEELSPVWMHGVRDADIVVVSADHWLNSAYFNNGYFPFVNGTLRGREFDWGFGFELVFRGWLRWAHNHTRSGKHVFFRSYSPWLPGNGDRPCPSVVPAFDGSLSPIRIFSIMNRMLEENTSGVVLLNITELSSMRNDAYVGSAAAPGTRYPDCSHWCSPGVPDIWNELLYAELLRRKLHPFD